MNIEPGKIQKLLAAAEAIEIKVAPPSEKEILMELSGVVEVLDNKGLTNKEIITWMRKRGYKFTLWYLHKARDKYKYPQLESESDEA